MEAWQNATNWLKKDLKEFCADCWLLIIMSYNQRLGYADMSDFQRSLQRAGETMSGFLFGCCCPNADSWTVVSGFQPIRPHKHTDTLIYIHPALKTKNWWAPKGASLDWFRKLKKKKREWEIKACQICTHPQEQIQISFLSLYKNSKREKPRFVILFLLSRKQRKAKFHLLAPCPIWYSGKTRA